MFRKSFLGIIISLIFASSTAFAFTDLNQNHQNRAAIDYLVEKGLVQGYQDNTVKPDQPINRAEALKVIMEGMPKTENDTIKGNSDLNFSDLFESDWYYDHVMEAVNQGLIQGYEDQTFRGVNTISLAEALKIILLAFDIKLTEQNEDMKWYEPYTTAALERRLIELNKDGLVHPETKLSRGELFEIMYRLMYIRENKEGQFDISLNWPDLEMAVQNFKIKKPFDWEIIKESNRTIIWHRDLTNNQIYYFSRSPLSAHIELVLDPNEGQYTANEVFASLQKTYCADNCNSNLNLKIPTLVKTNSSDNWFSQQQYLYLPNNKVMILMIEFGRDALENQFLEEINYMVSSLKYVEDGSIDQSNIDEILSTAYENIDIDGQGQNTLNLFPDLINIETDTIGVGAGPVDYYYSEQANVTLKYLRQFDTILDIVEGRTSDF